MIPVKPVHSFVPLNSRTCMQTNVKLKIRKWFCMPFVNLFFFPGSDLWCSIVKGLNKSIKPSAYLWITTNSPRWWPSLPLTAASCGKSGEKPRIQSAFWGTQLYWLFTSTGVIGRQTFRISHFSKKLERQVDENIQQSKTLRFQGSIG